MNLTSAQLRQLAKDMPPAQGAAVLAQLHPEPAAPKAATPPAESSALPWIILRIPLECRSEANQRRWKEKAARAKWQRRVICAFLGAPAAREHLPALPVTVVLTMVGPRELDSDNVQSALKACRDAVAACYGCGDSRRDPIAWEYGEQEIGPREVRIEIRSN